VSPDPSTAPVVVSLTTLPSRIGHLEPTLASLCAQTRRPDRIVLAIPPRSRREDCEYELPAFLTDGTFPDGLITVERPADDLGPGTKLLGALPTLVEPSILIVVDDDVEYAPYVIGDLAQAQAGDLRSSFSFYTYRMGGMVVGQGCDGFSFWSPNLDGIDEFAAGIVDRPECFHHDDLWISFFVRREGIAIRPLPPRGTGLVYEQLDRANALRDLDGDLARDDLNQRGLAYLMDEHDPSGSMRLRWQMDRVARRTGLRRVTTKIRWTLRTRTSR